MRTLGKQPCLCFYISCIFKINCSKGTMELVWHLSFFILICSWNTSFATYTDEFEYLRYSNTGTNDVSAEEIQAKKEAFENSSKRRLQVLSQNLESLIHDGIFGLEQFVEGSKPAYGNDDLDCRIRDLAFKYAHKILPASANFDAVFDALHLGDFCGQKKQHEDERVPYRGHMYVIGNLKLSGAKLFEYFVDPVLGHDFHVGSLTSPFRSLIVAVQACREVTRERLPHVYCVAYLRGGVHYLTDTLRLTSLDSNLIISRYLDEDATISGGTKVKPEWQLYKYDFEVYPLENSLFEGVKPGQSTETIKYVGKFEFESSCLELCSKDTKCSGYTYFNKSTGAYSSLCYHRLDGHWNPFYHTGVSSGKKVKIYVADLSNLSIKPFDQVFVNGKRAVRARFPNGDPELTGLHTMPTGYVSSASSWLPPKQSPPAAEIHISSPSRIKTPFPNFQIGIGGPVSQFDPPKSYWGTSNPTGGGGATYKVPSGLTYASELEMDRRAWSKPNSTIVHAFQHYHWGNWQFKLDKRDKDKRSLHWSYGGFQEARGNSDGKEWYVDNVREELDVANEWYFDTETKQLFYFPNGTELPSEIIVPQREEVVTLIGARDDVMKNVKLLGLTFAHSTTTFMKPYEVPSGGDWSVHKGAMVFAENIDGLLIDGCNFTSPGGNGLYLRGYVRNTVVSNNEFFKLGDNGIVLVGTSQLIDGTDEDQPRGVKVLKNLVRENGVWGKQSYAFVQAVSCETHLEGNVFFNGPRAGININDGFGGGNTFTNNLLFNFVRETDDHGPINTWDRQPFLTTIERGTASLLPKDNKITTNFLINNYRSVWPIDHDDGSCYWTDSNNFMVYGGFKNYLGHSKMSLNNVYVYPDRLPHTGASMVVPFCADTAGQSVGPGASGYGDVYADNTCILGKSSLYRLGSCDPHDLKDTIPFFANNRYYTQYGNATIVCGSTVWTLWEFQELGFDVGTTVNKLVSDDQIIDWGKQKLGLK